jgi:hypothetical protein
MPATWLVSAARSSVVLSAGTNEPPWDWPVPGNMPPWEVLIDRSLRCMAFSPRSQCHEVRLLLQHAASRIENENSCTKPAAFAGPEGQTIEQIVALRQKPAIWLNRRSWRINRRACGKWCRRVYGRSAVSIPGNLVPSHQGRPE